MDGANPVSDFTSQNRHLNIIFLTILLQKKTKLVLFDHLFALDGIYCLLSIVSFAFHIFFPPVNARWKFSPH